MKQEITTKAISFMRSWIRSRLDLVLKLDEEVKWAGEKQAIVKFEVEDFGRNIMLAEYMKNVQVEFRLTENEHGIHIWGVSVSFRFKAGGGNGWSHSSRFKLDNGNFIERSD